jgi:hypothetical protein
MAGNYPFHGKLHRSTHHTNPTPGILESGTDPIAGPSSKFQGIIYTQDQGTSENWYSGYVTLQANSGYWVSVYTTVYGNSSRWESVYTHVRSFSSNWQSTYLTVNILSGSWSSVYTTTNINSSYWDTAYSNLVVNSASYLAAISSIAYDPITSPNVFYTGRIQPLDLNVSPASVQAALSALHERVNALYVMFTGLTANQSTIMVSITSNN